MVRMLDVMIRFIRDADGATAIEYTLIAAIIGVSLIASVSLLGDGILDIFTRIESALREATTQE